VRARLHLQSLAGCMLVRLHRFLSNYKSEAFVSCMDAQRARTHTHMHAHTHTCMCGKTLTHTYALPLLCLCSPAQQWRTHTHTHTHSHSHTHTRTAPAVPLQPSATVEAFMMLHLDIDVASVNSVESALAHHLAPVHLTGNEGGGFV